MITFSSLFASSWPKIFQIISVIVIFFGFYGIAFAAGSRIKGKKQNSIALVLFLVPALILVMTGLGIPAIKHLLNPLKMLIHHNGWALKTMLTHSKIPIFA